MLLDDFSQLIDVLVDRFESDDLHHPVDRLLDSWPRIGRDLCRIDDGAAERHLRDQLQRGSDVSTWI